MQCSPLRMYLKHEVSWKKLPALQKLCAYRDRSPPRHWHQERPPSSAFDVTRTGFSFFDRWHLAMKIFLACGWHMFTSKAQLLLH